jgi:Alpha galactosidase A
VKGIVYALCQYGRAQVGTWGQQVGGNLWRTTGDIRDTYDSMTKIGFAQSDLAKYAGPGYWNDPDMLEIGNGGMSTEEYRMHFSLWSMVAAPLIAGNDLRSTSPEILDILRNKEVIVIDQDPLGKGGCASLVRVISKFGLSRSPLATMPWRCLIAAHKRQRPLSHGRISDALASTRYAICGSMLIWVNS